MGLIFSWAVRMKLFFSPKQQISFKGNSQAITAISVVFLFLFAFGDIFVPAVSSTVTFKAAVTRDMPIMCRLSTSTGVSGSTIPCSVSLFSVTTDVILSMSIFFCCYEKKNCRQANFVHKHEIDEILAIMIQLTMFLSPFR